MKPLKKIITAMLCAACCIAMLASVGVYAEQSKTEPLSPALHVLAAGTDMRVAALIGN